MTNLNSIKSMVEADLLISFFDLTNFVKISGERTAPEMFGMLSEFYELAGKITEAAGGKIVKFIGDAGLAIFPDAMADNGVLALRDLKIKAEEFFARRKVSTRLIVKIHFGSAAIGPLGVSGDKRTDVIGESVNTAATLASKGFAISPQAFRKLSAETRKLFRKHTPPVVYILSDQD